MPARLLREGILTSERVDALSLEAEVFYRRLMSVVDDFGLFHGDVRLIRAACFPLRLDRVSDADVRGWIEECRAAHLVATPTFGRKSVIVLLDFGQQVRAKASKHLPNETPEAIRHFVEQMQALDEHAHGVTDESANGLMTTAHGPLADAKHLPASAHLDGDGDGDGDGVVVDARARATPPPDDGRPPTSWSSWASWWRAERGIEVDPGDVRDRKRFVPLAERWIAAGVTREQMRRALEAAERDATEPIAYLPAYVDRVLANAQAPPRTAVQDRQADALARMTGGLMGRTATDARTIDVEPAAALRADAPRLAHGGG